MTDDENRPDDNEAPANVTPPGALLKAARKEARLSEEDVARELRMTVSKVRALEADDYAQLHSDTFVRGYLRTYAKLLALDPNDVLDAYKQARRAAGLEEESEESPLQISVPEPSRPLWRFALWILILLVGLWALSVWFLGNRQAPSNDAALSDPLPDMALEPQSTVQQERREESSGQQTEAGLPNEIEPDAEPGINGDTTGLADTALNGSADDAPATSLDIDNTGPGTGVEALASTQRGNGQTELSDPEVLDQLSLTFSDECWLEVIDARGDILAVDLVLEGRTLNLSGEAPFEVKMGNADAVSMELNGESVAFEVPSGRRTLTLTVN